MFLQRPEAVLKAARACRAAEAEVHRASHVTRDSTDAEGASSACGGRVEALRTSVAMGMKAFATCEGLRADDEALRLSSDAPSRELRLEAAAADMSSGRPKSQRGSPHMSPLSSPLAASICT